MFDHRNFTPKTELNLLSGVYIWILHANKIPPHIGISVDGNYYSLKANGKDMHVAHTSLLEIINRREIPTLLVKLKGVDLKIKDVEKAFLKYERAEAGQATCLFPLTELLLNETKDIILKELLEILVQRNAIETVFSLHLDAHFEGIPDYDKISIHERLKTIHAVTRRTRLPESR